MKYSTAVLAGTYDEYGRWTRDNSAVKDTFFAATPLSLQGRRVNAYVIVGTFWNRNRAPELFAAVGRNIAQTYWDDASRVIDEQEESRTVRQPKPGICPTNTVMFALQSVFDSRVKPYVKGYGELGFGMTDKIEDAVMFMDVPSLLQFVSRRSDHYSDQCGKYNIVKVRKGGWENVGVVL